MDRKADGQKEDEQRDRWTERQIDRKTDGQKDRQTGAQMDTKTDRKKDGQKDRQMTDDGRTYIQADRKRDKKQTDWQTERERQTYI